MTLEDDGSIVVTEEVADMVEEIAFIRAETKELKNRENTLRSQVLAALGAATVGLTGSGQKLVEVKVSNRTGIDRKKLEALFPEVYQQVETETEVTSLTIPTP